MFRTLDTWEIMGSMSETNSHLIVASLIASLKARIETVW
jgi:hypothetical protein